MKDKNKPVNIHAGHRQRLRANVLKNGLSSMHEHQVLEYMLTFVMPQKDTNELAHSLINEFGNLSNVLETDIALLKTVKGVGDVVAHYLYSFRHLYHYYQQNKLNSVKELINTQQTVSYFKTLLKGKITEELHLIGLDSQSRVIYSNIIERGTSNHTNITIRKITNVIINNNLSNVVIAHNHPSGSAKPSIEDDLFTRNLLVSLCSNDVNLLDHVVVGDEEVYSYMQADKLKEYKDEYMKVVNPFYIAQPQPKYEKSKEWENVKGIY